MGPQGGTSHGGDLQGTGTPPHYCFVMIFCDGLFGSNTMSCSCPCSEKPSHTDFPFMLRNPLQDESSLLYLFSYPPYQ